MRNDIINRFDALNKYIDYLTSEIKRIRGSHDNHE